MKFETRKVKVPFLTSSCPSGESDPTIVSSALRAFECCHSHSRILTGTSCTYGLRDYDPSKNPMTENAPWHVFSDLVLMTQN